MAGAAGAGGGGRFVKTALPMFGFVIISWLGLSQLMESKLRIRGSVRGYDKVEEHDPMERLRRLAAATPSSSPDDGGGGGDDSGAAPVRSLEAELGELLAKGKVDLSDYELKPVPRVEGDED